jgi:hypothetical protein
LGSEALSTCRASEPKHANSTFQTRSEGQFHRKSRAQDPKTTQLPNVPRMKTCFPPKPSLEVLLSPPNLFSFSAFEENRFSFDHFRQNQVFKPAFHLKSAQISAESENQNPYSTKNRARNHVLPPFCDSKSLLKPPT